MVLLSMILPVVGMFELWPPAVTVFLDRFVQAGVPREARIVIQDLLSGRPDAALAVLDRWERSWS
jgi:hypothetical protein